MTLPRSTNPILVEVTRGELVESFHRGAVVVAGPGAKTLLSLGDIQTPVFARSAIKAIQAMPLIETGAADAFSFGPAEIALACGSHVGSERHVAIGEALLERLHLTPAALACGPAMPANKSAAAVLIASGQSPTALCHPCSGKHIGMLATAKHLGCDTSGGGYADPGHPVQLQTKAAFEALAGVALTPHECGIDGCSVPTWALPLERLAAVFAGLATGDGLPPQSRAAISRIFSACWAEPELVAGQGSAETVILSALPGRVYLKSGAEAITCGALPELGLGFALKIDDGAGRAAAAAVMPLIEGLVPEARGLIKRGVLRTANGTEVGTIRVSADYQRALDRLAP